LAVFINTYILELKEVPPNEEAKKKKKKNKNKKKKNKNKENVEVFANCSPLFISIKNPQPQNIKPETQTQQFPQNGLIS